MDDDYTRIRNKLHSLMGTPVPAEELTKMLEEVIQVGGGVSIQIDSARFKVIQREGKFVLKKDDARPSTMPPRR